MSILVTEKKKRGRPAKAKKEIKEDHPFNLDKLIEDFEQSFEPLTPEQILKKKIISLENMNNNSLRVIRLLLDQVQFVLTRNN